MILQHITEEAVQGFIDGFDQVDINQLLADPGVQDILDGRIPQKIEEMDNPIGAIECFLQLFIDREEFEICSTIVEKWPALLIKPKEATIPQRYIDRMNEQLDSLK
jgi:hypothetical protein